MKLLIIAFTFFLAGSAICQNNDPVLFTVADNKVHLSEFRYIYEKNNAADADYSKESLEEYLELYKKFKLKVKRARDIGLDTVRVLQEELEGYRKQLAKSYLKDKEISERLVSEVLQRMKEDIELKHIFVAAELKTSEEKKSRAKQKIYTIYDKLVTNNGEGFDDMAKTLSEDKLSAIKGGNLGYYTSPLPSGFYEFENTMYDTPIGSFSKPIRSKMGYHIIKVTNRRPARGEMEIAHILIRKKNRSVNDAKIRIDSIYKLLNDGRNFENMAAKFSEDIKSKSNGGYIGFFAINQFEASFEDAAFALTKNNEYSSPVETNLGYHIIKRISKRDNSDEDRLRKRIQARINNNERFEIAELKMIENVKTNAGFKEDRLVLKRMSTALDESFYSYKWSPPEYDPSLILFELDGESSSLNDFAIYCKENVRERLKFNKSTNLDEAVDELYNAFVKEKVMKYEEEHLEMKYPDFRSLMREYREGILLFEITKQEVWDKASTDTVGLRKFFNEGSTTYEWPERVAVIQYNIDSDDNGAIAVYSYAQKKSHDKVIEKYSKSDQVKISFEEMIVDKNSDLIKNMELKPNGVTSLTTKPKPAHFLAFKELVPPKKKTLKEARGYVIADYQDYLEKQWIESLKNIYPVKVDKKVLSSITKK